MHDSSKPISGRFSKADQAQQHKLAKKPKAKTGGKKGRPVFSSADDYVEMLDKEDQENARGAGVGERAWLGGQVNGSDTAKRSHKGGIRGSSGASTVGQEKVRRRPAHEHKRRKTGSAR